MSHVEHPDRILVSSVNWANRLNELAGFDGTGDYIAFSDLKSHDSYVVSRKTIIENENTTDEYSVTKRGDELFLEAGLRLGFRNSVLKSARVNFAYRFTADTKPRKIEVDTSTALDGCINLIQEVEYYLSQSI